MVALHQVHSGVSRYSNPQPLHKKDGDELLCWCWVLDARKV